MRKASAATMAPRDACPVVRHGHRHHPILHPLLARSRERAPARVRPGAADACPRLRAGAAARRRRAPRELGARARAARARGRRRARPREAAGWFLGAERVAFLPSRGVRWESGLTPPPHLVGERARALDVLAAGGLVCVSARRSRTRCRRRRPEPVRDRGRRAPGIDGLAEELALAGYERVERVEDRGQFAVRGGLVDVFPTTGPRAAPDRALRRRDRADPRVLAVHAAGAPPVDGASSIPRPSAGSTSSSPRLADEGHGRVPDDLVPPLDRAPDLVWEPDEVRASGGGVRPSSSRSKAPTELDPLPASQPFAFEAQRPAIAARGLAEAENELAGFVRAGTGSSSRSRTAARRCARRTCSGGSRRACSRTATAAARRRAAVRRRAGAPRLRLARARPRPAPDTQVFRKRASARDARLGRALQSFADLRTGDYVVHEDHGVGKLLGFETKTVAGVTRDYLSSPSAATTASTSRTSSSARSRATSARTGGARALEARRQGLAAAQDARARAARELAGELLALYAQRQQAPECRYDLSSTSGWSGSRPSSRTARRRTSSARSRPSRRTSRRRGRWTGWSAATSASARRRWRSARRSRPRSTASRR